MTWGYPVLLMSTDWPPSSDQGDTCCLLCRAWGRARTQEAQVKKLRQLVQHEVRPSTTHDGCIDWPCTGSCSSPSCRH
jgi:hypothetical protein